MCYVIKSYVGLANVACFRECGKTKGLIESEFSFDSMGFKTSLSELVAGDEGEEEIGESLDSSSSSS